MLPVAFWSATQLRRLLPKEVTRDLSTIASRLRTALPETTGWRPSEPAKQQPRWVSMEKLQHSIWIGLKKSRCNMPPLILRILNAAQKIKHLLKFGDLHKLNGAELFIFQAFLEDLDGAKGGLARFVPIWRVSWRYIAVETPCRWFWAAVWIIRNQLL